MDYREHVELIKRWFVDRTDKSGVPSWEHSLNVARTLEEYINRHDEVPEVLREDMLLGALGHDLIEDAKVPEKTISTRWNSNVLSLIKALTNKKGDNDTQEYRHKLKGAAEEVLLIKFADILANADNSVKIFDSLKDEKWFKNSWMPLLYQYKENLFNRDFNKYPNTSKAFVIEIMNNINKLKELQRSKSLNIVICPPRSVCKKAITISNKLTRQGGLFALNENICHPHISIYMSEFPLKNLRKIRKLLEQISSEVKPFEIRSSIHSQKMDGYVYMNYHKTRDIRELQKKVINLLNPLREGLIREKDMVKMPDLNNAQHENIMRYGYRNVGSQFDPHLTFTKLEKSTRGYLSEFKDIDLSFNITEIGLFYQGDHGTCRKLIAKFKL
ncbi:MAG: hypothetical protein A3H98_11280 [Bacteroidetes bacterium RIFCSPLOWO2_02_FULL_36_8]|nr:MAG: hypothetical protein A3H98_11280 [Bacteroidetes bacterium RIFCSPLOWO2_02_FULL_36_8]